MSGKGKGEGTIGRGGVWAPVEPVLPDNPTPEQTAAHAAALMKYSLNLRVWQVAIRIAKPSIWPAAAAIDGPVGGEVAQARVAVTLADEYAPDAPEHMRDEAAVRAAGWLRDTEPALMARTSPDEEGAAVSVQYRATAGNALRASGGMAILSRYVTRRAV